MATMRKSEGESRNDLSIPTGHLEQVREILFGQQHRDLERKLSRLDTHFASDAESIRSDVKQRLEVLQEHLYKEIEALASRLTAEHRAQLDAVNQVARETRDGIAAIEQRVTKLEEGLARAQRDARQQTLDQAKHFIDELQSARADLTRAMEAESNALRDAIFNPLGSREQASSAPDEPASSGST